MPEDIKMAALESLVPADIEAHLQMNASKFDTYEKMRNEVVAYLEARTGTRMRESRVTRHDAARDPDKMDVDTGSLIRKGKNEKFTGQCHICGKTGHKAAECWYSGKGAYGNQKDKDGKGGKANPSGAKDGKGKGKYGNPKGKDGKDGKGKHYDKGKSSWKGKKGGKAAGSLEEENSDAWDPQWTQEESAEYEQEWYGWTPTAAPAAAGPGNEVGSIEVGRVCGQPRHRPPQLPSVGSVELGTTMHEICGIKTASGEI